MSDGCAHEKIRIIVDTEDGEVEKCPICHDIDVATLDDRVEDGS